VCATRSTFVWFQTASGQRLVPDLVTPAHQRTSAVTRNTCRRRRCRCREIDLSQIISARMTGKRQSCRSDICWGMFQPFVKQEIFLLKQLELQYKLTTFSQQQYTCELMFAFAWKFYSFSRCWPCLTPCVMWNVTRFFVQMPLRILRIFIYQTYMVDNTKQSISKKAHQMETILLNDHLYASKLLQLSKRLILLTYYVYANVCCTKHGGLTPDAKFFFTKFVETGQWLKFLTTKHKLRLKTNATSIDCRFFRRF